MSEATGLLAHLGDIGEELHARFPEIVVLYLFGSRAEGSARQDSDVDFAVLANHNPFRSTLVPQIGMLLGLVGLLVLWVAFFLRVFAMANALAFFLLLGLSAFLGTGLRTTFRLLSDDATQLSGQRLLTEATAGLLLAFGFALLYFAGGIALTGDVKYLTLKEESDFFTGGDFYVASGTRRRLSA